MKNLHLLTIALLLFTLQTAFAQKAKIKNKRIFVEYAALPEHNIPEDQRTYSIDIGGTYKIDKQEIANSLNLRGWTYQENDGAALVKIYVSDFVTGKSTRSERTEVKKDKEGNVTSRTKFYKYSSSNQGRARMQVFGPSNRFLTESEKEKQAKKKNKKNEKNEKKKENPFLKNTGDLVTEDATMEDGQISFADLSQSYKIEGSERTSTKEAYDSYISKFNAALSQQKEGYTRAVIRSANYSLNKTYGYNKQRAIVKFKKLKSKKHPEYETYNNATDALKEIFAAKKFNREFDDVNEALQPIIDYFEGIAAQYKSKDKHHKKLRTASILNIARIYYSTDRPDEAIAAAQVLVKEKLDEKAGKKLILNAENLKSKLAFHGVSQRCYLSSTDSEEVESDDEEEDEEAYDEEDDEDDDEE